MDLESYTFSPVLGQTEEPGELTLTGTICSLNLRVNQENSVWSAKIELDTFAWTGYEREPTLTMMNKIVHYDDGCDCETLKIYLRDGHQVHDCKELIQTDVLIACGVEYVGSTPQLYLNHVAKNYEVLDLKPIIKQAPPSLSNACSRPDFSLCGDGLFRLGRDAQKP